LHAASSGATSPPDEGDSASIACAGVQPPLLRHSGRTRAPADRSRTAAAVASGAELHREIRRSASPGGVIGDASGYRPDGSARPRAGFSARAVVRRCIEGEVRDPVGPPIGGPESKRSGDRGMGEALRSMDHGRRCKWHQRKGRLELWTQLNLIAARIGPAGSKRETGHEGHVLPFQSVSRSTSGLC
jgi:hypothetical protein